MLKNYVIPKPVDVRQRILEIPNNLKVTAKLPQGWTTNDLQHAFMTTALLGFRVGELCGIKAPSDPNNATGHTLTVQTTTYTPNLRIREERRTILSVLEAEYAIKGIDMTTSQLMQAAAKIHEPIAIFTVQVLKRKDQYYRRTAMPLNPEYEPWTQPVLKYIQERQKKNEIVFPINRQEMLRQAHRVFDGFSYKIRAYRTYDLNEDGSFKYYEKNGERKKVMKTIGEHYKPFGDHAIRHSWVEHKKQLGIHGPLLTTMIGWKPARKEETLEEIYGETTWRAYLPYLLVTQW